MRRIVFALLIVALLAPAAAADQIRLNYTFATPELVAREAGGVEPVITGLPQHLVPGEPIVPVQTAWIAIPQGHEVVAVDVTPAKAALSLPGDAAWAPKFAPLSRPTDKTALPSAAIYGGVAPFPATIHRTLSLQYKRGVAIQPIALHPVRYLPGDNRFAFTPELAVTVTTRPRNDTPDVLSYRGLAADRRELRMRVDNPAALNAYVPETVSKGDPLDYAIIAPEQYHAQLAAFATHKAERFGLRVELVSLEQVLEQTTGFDDAAKARNYLKARYADGLQWALLVGDANVGDEIFPIRPLFVTGTDPDDGSSYTDNRMASDQYFGCLDGNYNFDNDANWAEPTDGEGGGEVDLLYDLHVGRFAIEQPWEITAIAGKTMAFENDTETPWRALFVGEYADAQTWGGDNKDKVYEYCAADFPVTKLYDRDGTNRHSNVVRAINSNGHQWLNHLGHADVLSNMGFSPSGVTELENELPYLGFSQGCFSGSVDGRDAYGGSGYANCMGEEYTSRHAGGAFAYFMNTRYGFYLAGRVDGPSNVYDWQLAEAFFADGIPHIGAAMDKGKEDCIGVLAPTNMMRWSWYTLFLFGDPHTPMRLNCDNDADGVLSDYCGGEDCNDENEGVFPTAEEICDDGIDNNCDGLADLDDPACAPEPADDDTPPANDDDDSADDDSVGDDDPIADDDDSAADDDDDDDDDDNSGGCG
jgi:Peptidase family C25/Propeptide_C25